MCLFLFYILVSVYWNGISIQVDVFAYGMTLYEMLSLRSPFDNVHPVPKRNQEIRDKERPSLQAKETRSLLLFQELMSLCWSHEPDDRPRMKQVCDWVESPEFERLRAEVSLKDVKSISCACVCRILPENEEEFNPNGSLQQKERISAPMFKISEENDSDLQEDEEAYLYDDPDDNLLMSDLSFKQYQNSEPPGLKSLYHHDSPGHFVPQSAPNPSNFDPHNLRQHIGTSIPTYLGPPDVIPLAVSPERADGLFETGHRSQRESGAIPQGGLLYQNGHPGSHFSDPPQEIRRNILLTMTSEDGQGIEPGHGIGDTKDGETGTYKFLPSKLSNSTHEDENEDDDVMENHVFEPYTQIWLCGKDQRKGLLQIFKYNDHHPGQYVSWIGYMGCLCCVLESTSVLCEVWCVLLLHSASMSKSSGSSVGKSVIPLEFMQHTHTHTHTQFSLTHSLSLSHTHTQTFSGYCSSDEVAAICPVRNTIWIGTSTGTLKIFHAPTLKTKFNGKLQLPKQPPSFILDIRHVPETSTVLVANANGDIWSLYDRIVPGGIQIQNRIELSDLSPCYHLVKVNEQGHIEVWGTMENNRLLILEKSADSSEMWAKSELKVEPGNPKLQLCSYIVHTCFTGRDGRQLSHIWVSYRNRSVLVSFDVKPRSQRCVLNCAETLRSSEFVGGLLLESVCVRVCVREGVLYTDN